MGIVHLLIFRAFSLFVFFFFFFFFYILLFSHSQILAQTYSDFGPFGDPEYMLRGKTLLSLEVGVDYHSADRQPSGKTHGSAIALEYFVIEAFGFGYRITDATFSLVDNPHKIADLTFNTYEVTMRINFTHRRRFVPFMRFGLGGATGSRDAFVYQHTGTSCYTQPIPHTRAIAALVSIEYGLSYAPTTKVYVGVILRYLSAFSLGGHSEFLSSYPLFPPPQCSLPYYRYRSGELDFSAMQARFLLSMRL